MVSGGVRVAQIQPQWSTVSDRALATGAWAQPAEWPSPLTRQAGLPRAAFTVAELLVQ